jgi:REP element-mobilizing transposase RayT
MQQQKRISLFAFVIMPSHLHFIIKPENDSIGDIVQQFGSFTAHEILKELRANNQNEILNLFQQKKRDQRHDIAYGRIYKPRTFTKWTFWDKRWSTFIKTLLQKIGSWRNTEQTTLIQAQDFMIMAENPLLKLQI